MKFSPFESDYFRKISLFKGKITIFAISKKYTLMIDVALINYMNDELAATPKKMQRYMAKEIAWDDRMIGLVGPRGIGKSTLVKQQIITDHSAEYQQLYVSADHTYFSMHSLLDVAREFVMEGGRRLVIDEIHKYKGWSNELKQIYDQYKDLKVIFTGSSILHIRKGGADLSRRALIFEMQGLSFREYLNLFEDIKIPVMSIDEINNNRITPIPDFHPLPHFRKYLESGYYPFCDLPRFDMRMQQILSETIEVDIPTHVNMTPATARKLKRMAMIIANNAPYKPNMLNLSVELGISKNDIPTYLVYLEKTGILGLLKDSTGGMRGLGKLEKVFLDNPSLMTSISNGTPNIGNLRETFFYNQMRVRNDVVSSKISDFEINGVTYEVGGAGKGGKQLDKAERGIIVRDDIEYGHGNVVPLWLFGLNY